MSAKSLPSAIQNQQKNQQKKQQKASQKTNQKKTLLRDIPTNLLEQEQQEEEEEEEVPEVKSRAGVTIWPEHIIPDKCQKC